MRYAALLALLLLAPAAHADRLCRAITWKSLGQISCQVLPTKVTLVYSSSLAWRQVELSGRRQDLLIAACREAPVVEEIISHGDGLRVLITQCPVVLTESQ